MKKSEMRKRSEAAGLTLALPVRKSGRQGEEFSRLQKFILAETERNGGTLSLREALRYWPGEEELGHRVSVYLAFRRLCERGFIEPFIQAEGRP